jgi:hypothetical protein
MKFAILLKWFSMICREARPLLPADAASQRLR